MVKVPAPTRVIVAVLPCLAIACAPAFLRRGGPPVTHGVAVGEVTPSTAVVWARCERQSHVRVTVDEPGRPAVLSASAAAPPAHDYTAHVRLDGLRPETRYRYQVWCLDDPADTPDPAAGVAGSFRTAPDDEHPAAVRFIWGGDVAGQNTCRDRTDGYLIFRTINDRAPDFFIGLGDMIYADDPCLPTGRYGNQQIPGPAQPASDLPAFWSYWKYNRDDEALRQLLAATPYYGVWDDHEVLNDFDPQHDVGAVPPYPPDRHLLPIGLQAFVDYNPFPDAVQTSHRLYRAVRWGRHVELFLLDTRQYRDPNSAPDDTAHPKTMLGTEQLAWLKEGLRTSDATWKVIVTSVPLSVPTGSTERGRDGWANFDHSTGFEHELLDIVEFLRARDINNTIWISTDIHFAAVFRDTPFADAPKFQLYEIDTGPLNAGVLPKTEVDVTLHPQQLFHFPDNADPAQGFEQAKSWFNFGEVRVDAAGDLAVDIINSGGKRLYTLSLRPSRP